MSSNPASHFMYLLAHSVVVVNWFDAVMKEEWKTEDRVVRNH